MILVSRSRAFAYIYSRILSIGQVKPQAMAYPQALRRLHRPAPRPIMPSERRDSSCSTSIYISVPSIIRTASHASTTHTLHPSRAPPSRPLCLLLRHHSCLPLISPLPLLQQHVLPLRQHRRLPLLDAHHPVSEARTGRCVERVYPEAAPREEGPHFDTELPYANKNAYRGRDQQDEGVEGGQ